jgi:membrane peptidoglycan carboxypeptidase
MSGPEHIVGLLHRLLTAGAVALVLAASPVAAQSPDYASQISAARQLAAEIRPIWFDAVIAAEDPSFRKRARGGSSITAYAAQLLVRETQPALARSKANARRMHTTLALASAATRDEIICITLQLTDFGLGTYGHDTAARRFFRKGANELSLAEVATLAGLIKAPEVLLSDPAQVEVRRDVVLRAMHAAGAITDQDLQTALGEPLHLSR